MNKTELENEIVGKGLTAPRVTPADIKASVVSEHYFTAYDGVKYVRNFLSDMEDSESLKLLTFCVLVLDNGFTVVGESACASAENFNKELGQKIARQKAEEKIWSLLGFRLRDKLAAA